MYERRWPLSHWRRADGARPRLGEFPFQEAEMAPPRLLVERPDRLSFSEATGNEGRASTASTPAPPWWSGPAVGAWRCLADPKAREWRYKAAQAARGHVEQSIKQSGCDLDCTTDTRGRPYTLICTKNQASYVRRAEQRKGDLRSLKALGA